MPLFFSADIHQGNERFSVHSRGKQCAFMSLSALLTARNIPLNLWSRITFKYALLQGNNMFLNALDSGLIILKLAMCLVVDSSSDSSIVWTSFTFLDLLLPFTEGKNNMYDLHIFPQGRKNISKTLKRFKTTKPFIIHSTTKTKNSVKTRGV